MKIPLMLREDHRNVARALFILELAADNIDSDKEVDPVMVDETILFLKEFADRCHHAKEERVIFPAIIEKHDGQAQALIDALTADHRASRLLITGMKKANDAYSQGDTAALDELYVAMKDYSSLLEKHILVEDTRLADIIEHSLSSVEDEGLFEDCEKIEEELPLGHHALLEIVERVESRIKQ